MLKETIVEVSIPNRELDAFPQAAKNLVVEERLVSIPNRELDAFPLYLPCKLTGYNKWFQSLIGS